MKLILASASSRRQELLGRITENFVTIVSDFDEEKVPYEGSCESYVISLAKGKALNVADKLKEESLVIGCDTIVTLDDKVLGKPKDKEQAFEMLTSLSNRSHRVYSGICIVNSKTGEIKSDFMCTEVEFSELSQEDILNYIESGDPFDKAGAYGIQGYAGVFVEGIKGCYYNVVGLPLNKLKKMLKEIGGNF